MQFGTNSLVRQSQVLSRTNKNFRLWVRFRFRLGTRTAYQHEIQHAYLPVCRAQHVVMQNINVPIPADLFKFRKFTLIKQSLKTTTVLSLVAEQIHISSTVLYRFTAYLRVSQRGRRIYLYGFQKSEKGQTIGSLIRQFTTNYLYFQGKVLFQYYHYFFA